MLRPAMLRVPIVTVVSLLAVACTGADVTEQTQPAPLSTVPLTTAATTRPSTAPPSSTAACPPGPDMVDEGRLVRVERPDSDARRLSGVAWTADADCETFAVTFGTDDGAPATTPPTVTATLLGDNGVLRIELDIEDSAVMDQLVESRYVERLFVPTTPGGARVVDLFLSEAVAARAIPSTSPARVLVDLQPGQGDNAGSPIVTDDLVVISPGSGAPTGSPIRVSGYARSGPLVVELLDGEEVVAELEVELVEAEGGWALFSTTIEDPAADFDRVSLTAGQATVGVPVSP